MYLDLFKKRKLPLFRTLGDELTYRNSHPINVIITHARIYLKSYYEKEKEGKILDYMSGQENSIWEGDLDLARDTNKLVAISKEIGESLVITSSFGKLIIEIEETADKKWIKKIGIDKWRESNERIKKAKKDALFRMH